MFGEYADSVSIHSKPFLEACRESGIDAEITSDIRRAIWEKFALIVGVSATTTTMRNTIGPIRANQRTRTFLLDVMREAVAVGREHGVHFDEDYAENRLAFCDGMPSEMTSSMHTDLEQGRRLKVEWLSGSVVELGKAVGIETPLNRAVRDILALHARPQ